MAARPAIVFTAHSSCQGICTGSIRINYMSLAKPGQKSNHLKRNKKKKNVNKTDGMRSCHDMHDTYAGAMCTVRPWI
jgi:hypothetical protein